MNGGDHKEAPAADVGMRRYLTLSLENPLLRYGMWVLFVLLAIRLSYVGYKGIIVPAVGERATTYYVTPRTIACEKPNPQYEGMAEKARQEASPVYMLDNGHVEGREKLLRSIERKLAADVERLRQLRAQLSHLEQRQKEGGTGIKESPFYRGEKREEPDRKPAVDGEQRRLLLEHLGQTREHATALLSTIAPGLSGEQQEGLLDVFQRRPSYLHDALRAASLALDEVRRWLIVESVDFGFQRDRGRGIVLGPSNRRLLESQRVLSYVEALDLVRGNYVARLISENFPRIKGNKNISVFVTRIVVAAVKPNLSKDERRTESAITRKLGQIPKTVPVEFTQGQSIVALGETVESWQAECIGRFSVKTVGRAGLGSFMGVPVPTLLLLLGLAMLVLLASITLRSFALRVFRDRPLKNGDYLAVGVLLVLHLALIRAFLFLAGVLSISYPEMNKSTMLTACPVALSVMVASTLMGARVSFLSLLFVVVTTALIALQSGPELLAGNFPAYFTLYMLSVGLVGIWVTRMVKRRGSYFVAGMAAGGAGIVFWLIVFLVEGGQVPRTHAVQLSLASLASGALSYILLISLTPLFEYLWDYTTDSRLIELASSEHPALKELSRRAPGTYQHSLWIASLVEEAAEAIDANPLLAKVGAYYHDLGKLAAAAESGLPRGATDSPLFFAENQALGHNPHDHLTPLMSARILRKHVELSIRMIRKYRLGRSIEDIAAQHHGTGLMLHFYNKARAIAEAEGETIDERDFRYPGPKPQTKEAALVMMADSVEAAVRALPQHTEERIAERVRTIIRERRTDGQLDDSTLTFGDVRRIEESFIKTLVTMYHARPEYATNKPEEQTVRLKREAALAAREAEEQVPTREVEGPAAPEPEPARPEPEPAPEPEPEEDK